MSELRTVEQRKADVLETLERQGHMWLATAHADIPHVIAVSALWGGDELVLTTVGTSRSAQNLRHGAAARLVAGTQDDAVVILAEVVDSRPAAEAADLAERWHGVMGWDPREVGEGWWMYRLRPRRIQAFRGYDEIEGREVMRDGRWLA
jgi:hypothetical protein